MYTQLLCEFNETITLMDMDIDYSFYALLSMYPPHSPLARLMIILIILMRHFMSRNGIEIEWFATAPASCLWSNDNGSHWNKIFMMCCAPRKLQLLAA